MSRNQKLKLKFFRPAFLWAIFVFILSAIPGSAFPVVTSFWDWLSPDKAVHLLFYGLLSFFLMRGFYRQYGLNRKRFYPEAFTLFAGIIFGTFLEVMQHYVFTGRDGNVYDAGANAMGCLFGIMIFRLMLQKKKLNWK